MDIVMSKSRDILNSAHKRGLTEEMQSAAERDLPEALKSTMKAWEKMQNQNVPSFLEKLQDKANDILDSQAIRSLSTLLTLPPIQHQEAAAAAMPATQAERAYRCVIYTVSSEKLRNRNLLVDDWECIISDTYAGLYFHFPDDSYSFYPDKEFDEAFMGKYESCNVIIRHFSATDKQVCCFYGDIVGRGEIACDYREDFDLDPSLYDKDGGYGDYLEIFIIKNDKE